MGTVIITGANSSLGLPAVSYLLSKYPTNTLICTVRNDSEDDPNTAKLRAAIAQSPNNANVSIRKLDLASLTEVRKFTDTIVSEIDAKKIPRLVAVIWNAMSWTLHGGLNFTEDGYERSMAINHIAHFAMTLRLLGSFDLDNGRIVFLGSDSHEKSGLQELPTVLPEDPDLLVHPPPDKEGEGEAVRRGFLRYGLSKLLVVMTMYELNRRLKKSNDLKGLTALAVDPGALLDSRALSGPDVPSKWTTQVSVLNFLQPVLKYLNPIFLKCSEACKNVVDAALSPEFAGQEGYFILKKKTDSSLASRDEKMQGFLWNKSVEWAGIKQEDTVLPL